MTQEARAELRKSDMEGHVSERAYTAADAEDRRGGQAGAQCGATPVAGGSSLARRKAGISATVARGHDRARPPGALTGAAAVMPPQALEVDAFVGAGTAFRVMSSSGSRWRSEELQRRTLCLDMRGKVALTEPARRWTTLAGRTSSITGEVLRGPLVAQLSHR